MRNRAATVLAAFALLALAVAACDDDEPTYYLAIGDSLVEGEGATDPATSAFAPLFLEHLVEAADSGARLRMLNLSRGGETTTTLISEGQLAEALTVIADPERDVRVVTLHVGGNDGAQLFEVCGVGLSAECQAAIATTLGALDQNYEAALAQLRDAVGDEVTIIVGTYHNALAHTGCELNAFAALGDAVLEGDSSMPAVGLNDVIRETAARHGALVAEVGPLAATELAPDCRHTNDAGHAKIAAAYARAFDAR